MAQLSPNSDGEFCLRFAGDVFNTLVHLKRLMGDSVEAKLFSVLGEDPFSVRARAQLKSEGICDEGVFTNPDRTIGLCAVSRDTYGERAFTYWRKQSAATSLIQYAKAALEELKTDVIYLSGISLAILPESDRHTLVAALQRAQAKGALLAFDPNARTALWSDPKTAQRWFERLYGIADFIFTGMEDEQLFGADTPKQVIERILDNYGLRHVIVTNGARDVHAYVDGTHSCVATVNDVTVVDTTGAGDAFNAGFLSTYMQGGTPEDALNTANQLSAFTVSVRGAIPDKQDFRKNYCEIAP